MHIRSVNAKWGGAQDEGGWVGAGTDISEGLATNRAQFTSHMYSQFR